MIVDVAIGVKMPRPGRRDWLLAASSALVDEDQETLINIETYLSAACSVAFGYLVVLRKSILVSSLPLEIVIVCKVEFWMRSEMVERGHS